jgi:hypothetical protein
LITKKESEQFPITHDKIKSDTRRANGFEIEFEIKFITVAKNSSGSMIEDIISKYFDAN